MTGYDIFAITITAVLVMTILLAIPRAISDHLANREMERNLRLWRQDVKALEAAQAARAAALKAELEERKKSSL